jgi:uncharacterized protein (TIGR03437 family)
VTINACSVPLATGEYSADSKNPPTTLGGTTVRITDSAGIDRLAPLYYVSSSQVKYVVPRDVANGAARVTVTAADGSTTVAPLEVASVEPGLFCTEVCGWTPAPKGYLVRVRDGLETEEPIEPGAHEISQIDLGPDTDQVYLVMLGTGWRNRSSLANVSVKFGDLEAPVQYAGPQGDYAGLDQVKVLLPRWPAGHTSQEEGVQVWLTVDGKLANPLFLAFR